MTVLRQRMTEDMQARNSAAAYTGIVSPAGIAVCTLLPYVAGCTDPRAHPNLSNLPHEREEAGPQLNTYGCRGASVPLQDYAQDMPAMPLRHNGGHRNFRMHLLSVAVHGYLMTVISRPPAYLNFAALCAASVPSARTTASAQLSCPRPPRPPFRSLATPRHVAIPIAVALPCPASFSSGFQGAQVEHVFSPPARIKVCTQPLYRGRAAALKTLCIMPPAELCRVGSFSPDFSLTGVWSVQHSSFCAFAFNSGEQEDGS